MQLFVFKALTDLSYRNSFLSFEIKVEHKLVKVKHYTNHCQWKIICLNLLKCVAAQLGWFKKEQVKTYCIAWKDIALYSVPPPLNIERQ